MSITEEQKDSLLREVNRLHERQELSKAVGEDYFEPGMMEYLDKSDGMFDPSNNAIMLRFEVMGTRYEGRTELIERVKLGDTVLVERDPENKFNCNNFTFTSSKGRNLGNMPASLCNALAPMYDEGNIKIERAFVSYVEPLSKRNRHAKKSVLFVELHLNLINIL